MLQEFKNFILFVFVFFIVSVSFAQENQGYEDYKKGKYHQAFKKLKGPAENGDPKAQLYIGMMYHIGTGVAQNEKEAVKWLKLASEQKNTTAMKTLANILFDNQKEEKDVIMAYVWSSLAIEYSDQASTHTKNLITQYLDENQKEEGEKIIRQYKNKWSR